MNTNFKVIGLTRLEIKPESTAPDYPLGQAVHTMKQKFDAVELGCLSDQHSPLLPFNFSSALWARAIFFVVEFYLPVKLPYVEISAAPKDV